jgi:hypothetical protein
MPQLDPQEAVRIAAAVGVDLEALPPLTQRSRGHVYAVDALPGMDEEDREMVLKVRGNSCVFRFLLLCKEGVCATAHVAAVLLVLWKLTVRICLLSGRLRFLGHPGIV